MAHKELIVALSMLVVIPPVSASQPEEPIATAAPEGTADTKYCMRVEAITGTRIEKIRCWTRDQWAEQEVDVDEEWAKEGVRVIG